MPTLHIDLQDGFTGQPVAVRLGGREVYARPAVRTDLRIARADGFEAQAADGPQTLEVEAGGVVARQQVDPARTPYLAINLDGQGRPSVRAAEEPFAYL